MLGVTSVRAGYRQVIDVTGIVVDDSIHGSKWEDEQLTAVVLQLSESDRRVHSVASDGRRWAT